MYGVPGENKNCEKYLEYVYQLIWELLLHTSNTKISTNVDGKEDRGENSMTNMIIVRNNMIGNMNGVMSIERVTWGLFMIKY